MNAILSIKPVYAKRILAGKKKYEYRKTRFKQPVERVFIYASSPMCRIIGEFRFDDLLHDSPARLWARTRRYSGIGLSDYMAYFDGKLEAYAYTIKSFVKYDEPIDPKAVIPGFRAPQSFSYIDAGAL